MFSSRFSISIVRFRSATKSLFSMMRVCSSRASLVSAVWRTSATLTEFWMELSRESWACFVLLRGCGWGMIICDEGVIETFAGVAWKGAVNQKVVGGGHRMKCHPMNGRCKLCKFNKQDWNSFDAKCLVKNTKFQKNDSTFESPRHFNPFCGHFPATKFLWICLKLKKPKTNIETRKTSKGKVERKHHVMLNLHVPGDAPKCAWYSRHVDSQRFLICHSGHFAPRFSVSPASPCFAWFRRREPAEGWKWQFARSYPN